MCSKDGVIRFLNVPLNDHNLKKLFFSMRIFSHLKFIAWNRPKCLNALLVQLFCWFESETKWLFNHYFITQVSWIRHRDIHILTVGTYTYTTDQRFQTAYHREFNEWTMQIKWAQKRDAGMYECQISTIPIKSFSVRLNVVGTCFSSI